MGRSTDERNVAQTSENVATSGENDIATTNNHNNHTMARQPQLTSTTKKVSLHLSKELREFYKNHDVDLTKLADGADFPYRYVRLNPRYDRTQTLEMLRKEVRKLRDNNSHGCGDGSDCNKDKDTTSTQNSSGVKGVPWLESLWGFFAIPASFRLSASHCFRTGRIYGMDVSSGAGVAVLLTDHHDKITTVDPDPSCSDLSGKLRTTEERANNWNANKNDTNGDKNREVRILDLCCSPGLKLLQMADFFHGKDFINSRVDGDAEDGICVGGVGQKQRSVKVVGVDISKHRLDICKTIVNKYFIDPETSGSGERSKKSLPANVKIQLYNEDGTLFGTKGSRDGRNLIFDSTVATEEMMQRGGKRKRMNKSARAREKKRLREIAFLECVSATSDGNDSHNPPDADHTNSNTDAQDVCIDGFDYVLVDAECSTDGSFKHVKERIKGSSGGHYREENTMLTDPAKLAELVDLQRKLVASGFRLLKDGGTLVYSTCSLSEDQNEKVVKWLLETNEDAFLIPVHFPSIQTTKFVTDGTLTGTVRFYPNLLHNPGSSEALWGDGFFVAKLGKRTKRIKK